MLSLFLGEAAEGVVFEIDEFEEVLEERVGI
nr:hypothetical protein [Chlamydiota bacterium]